MTDEEQTSFYKALVTISVYNRFIQVVTKGRKYRHKMKFKAIFLMEEFLMEYKAKKKVDWLIKIVLQEMLLEANFKKGQFPKLKMQKFFRYSTAFIYSFKISPDSKVKVSLSLKKMDQKRVTELTKQLSGRSISKNDVYLLWSVDRVG